MRKDALIALIVASLLVIPLVYASEVSRSISPSSVEEGGTVDVTLEISATGGDESFAIDENFDNSAFTLTDDGGGSTSQAGHLKWIVCGECDSTNPCMIQKPGGVWEECECCLEVVDGATYTYTLQAGSSTGTKYFSGEYMFDSMSTEENITGDDTVTVTSSQTSCSSYTTSYSCNNDASCDWCLQCSSGQYSGGPNRCVTSGACVRSCTVGYCSATCASSGDCSATNCDSSDGCYSGTYRDYSNPANTCQSGCTCTSNPCSSYSETGTDNDGDGYDTQCGDWDDNPSACGSRCYPGAPEVCDGYDNDNDGQTDEGCDDDNDNYCDSSMTIVVGSSIPTCTSTNTYSAATIQNTDDCDDDPADCGSACHPGATEICDNEDNNCDGTRDTFTQPCGPQNNTGICVIGSQTCTYGHWGSCNGDVMPEPEVCDELDNDCDGTVDDVLGGNSVQTTKCRCYDGGSPLADETYPQNGIDDDCNGQVDDCTPFETAVCSHLDGVCSESQDTCSFQGSWTGCDYTSLPDYEDPESTCDGKDNDCDGDEDEGCACTPGQVQNCAKQLGVCLGSTQTCTSGGVWPGCDYSTIPDYQNPESTCDGKDNDCDGFTDEGVKNTYYFDDDNDGFGDSTISVSACSPPADYVADDQDCDDSDENVNPDATEVCDGEDNNCDGNVDFNTNPGDLGCTGNVVVTADYYDGSTTDFSNVADLTDIPGMILEKAGYGMIEFLDDINISYSVNLNPPNTRILYNNVSVNTSRFPFLDVRALITLYGLDFLNPVVLRNGDKCSSSICTIVDYTDGDLVFNVTGFSVYSATGSCSDGTLYGECSSTKPKYCENGTLINKAGTCGCPSGKVRDGNNCVEESSSSSSSSSSSGGICDEGEQIPCSFEGICQPAYQTCIGGFYRACEGPDPEPEVCDGLDNDCDGEVDEGIVCLCENGDTRACGPANDVGECSFGVSVCSMGSWGDCTGAVYSSTELCDGKDNDCDGQTDEDCSSDACQEGIISSPCVCNEEVRYSGYCCQNVFFTDGCPGYPYSIFIYIGLLILIGVFIYLFTDNGTKIKPFIDQLFR